jgi:hypothetical protein
MAPAIALVTKTSSELRELLVIHLLIIYVARKDVGAGHSEQTVFSLYYFFLLYFPS